MSTDSESDEEYVPREPEQLSEEESANEETDLQFEKECEQKTIKRKICQNKQTKKRQKTKNSHETENETKPADEPGELDPEEEKKKEEELWAKFLDGTDTKKPTVSKAIPKVGKETLMHTSSESVLSQNESKSKQENSTNKEKRIFEFAGETIVVENNVIKEKCQSNPKEKTENKNTLGHGSGGLSNLLSQLKRKNQLSTLEKSKLDWDTFKKQEGIEEEIQSFNKGKQGYLERKDFLERADYRQYEIERDLRRGKRSNR